MIKYISTRGKAPVLSFKDAVLAGLASDGGLYVPDSIPQFSPHDIAAMAGLSYTELALRVMTPFIGNDIPEKDLRKLVEGAYKDFRHKAIAPLKQLGHNEFLLELFHGPTLAFKDFALQLLGRMLEYFLTKSNQRLTIIGATSGDTGSAAIEGCRGRENMRIFIYYPNQHISEIQRRQMTTITDSNVVVNAVNGSFDDCQNIVKRLFADTDFREKHHLTAVNSINWARILAQVVYYFYAFYEMQALGNPAQNIAFSVPTGNFGDIYAGYIAKQLGLPIDKLIIATNSNDILARCLKTGDYEMDTHVHATNSPSMDIQVSSNFERLLFDLYGKDGAAIEALMQKFHRDKKITLSQSALAQLRQGFAAGSADDAATKDTIKSVYNATHELLDPHTAVGVKVGREWHINKDIPLIMLATAHPAKFPDAVKEASGEHPILPLHLSSLMSAPERHPNVQSMQAIIKPVMVDNQIILEWDLSPIKADIEKHS